MTRRLTAKVASAVHQRFVKSSSMATFKRVRRRVISAAAPLGKATGFCVSAQRARLDGLSTIAPAMKCRERSKPVGRGLHIPLRSSPKGPLGGVPRRNAKPTNLRCEIVKAQMHFSSDAQMPRSVKTAIAVLTDRVPALFFCRFLI